MDTLLRERGSLQASQHGAQIFISQGTEVEETLRNQANILRGTNNAISSIRGTFTGIDSIYGAIRRKYTRDTIILSSFTAFLILFLLYWWARS
jgi:golgi SNAP receptor complex member 1